MTVPRLGVASVVVSISDAEGLVVRHGNDENYILASKPADECSSEDWRQLWALFDKLGLVRS